MKERTVTVFEAWDGQTFQSAAECTGYERDNAARRMVGLTDAQIETALAYEGDTAIADAIEAAGSRIAKARLAKGIVRRIRHNHVDNDPELPAPVGREPVVNLEAEQEAS